MPDSPDPSCTSRYLVASCADFPEGHHQQVHPCQNFIINVPLAPYTAHSVSSFLPGTGFFNDVAAPSHGDGLLDQSPFLNPVFDNWHSQSAPQQLNFHGPYNESGPQHLSALIGLVGFEDSLEVSAGVEQVPLDFLNDGIQIHNPVLDNEPLWWNQGSQPLYGAIDFEDTLNDGMTSPSINSIGNTDRFGDVGSLTGSEHGTPFQGQYLANELAVPHLGPKAQELFNEEEFGFDYSTIDILGNGQFSSLFLPPDGSPAELLLGSTTVPPVQSTINTTASVPVATNIPAPAPETNLANQAQRLHCTTCNATFKREGDRRRHITSKHQAHYGIYLCPIAGCFHSQGAGYSRADKLTEHLWKKHADLGYTKAGL